MARVEAHAKFSKPIRHGVAIRVRLSPQIRGLKTIRYDFVILDDQRGEDLAAGYITVVCVDAVTFKSRQIPDRIRKTVEQYIYATCKSSKKTNSNCSVSCRLGKELK